MFTLTVAMHLFASHCFYFHLYSTSGRQKLQARRVRNFTLHLHLETGPPLLAAAMRALDLCRIALCGPDGNRAACQNALEYDGAFRRS